MASANTHALEKLDKIQEDITMITEMKDGKPFGKATYFQKRGNMYANATFEEGEKVSQSDFKSLST